MVSWTPDDYAKWKSRNPATDPVAPLPAPVQKRDPAPALERNLSRKRKVPTRPVVIVSIVAFRRCLLDEDAVNDGYKALQDDLSERLGVDDGERDLIKFEYGQVWSETEGTLIKIQETSHD